MLSLNNYYKTSHYLLQHWAPVYREAELSASILAPKVAGAESYLRDRVLGEVTKDNFITLPDKGGHSRPLPRKTMCSHPGGFDEEFYDNTSQGWGC